MRTRKLSLLTRPESSGHLKVSPFFLGVSGKQLSALQSPSFRPVSDPDDSPYPSQGFLSCQVVLNILSIALGTRFFLSPRDEVMSKFSLSKAEYVCGMAQQE